MLNMKDTHLYCGADFCCKASGHWCLVTDEQAARFCYRLKKGEEEERKTQLQKIQSWHGILENKNNVYKHYNRGSSSWKVLFAKYKTTVEFCMFWWDPLTS